MSARQLVRAARRLGEVSLVLIKYGVPGLFASTIFLLAICVVMRVNWVEEIRAFLTYYLLVLFLAVLACIIGGLTISSYLAIARRKRNWAMTVLLLGGDVFCGYCFVQVAKWFSTLL